MQIATIYLNDDNQWKARRQIILRAIPDCEIIFLQGLLAPEVLGSYPYRAQHNKLAILSKSPLEEIKAGQLLSNEGYPVDLLTARTTEGVLLVNTDVGDSPHFLLTEAAGQLEKLINNQVPVIVAGVIPDLALQGFSRGDYRILSRGINWTGNDYLKPIEHNISASSREIIIGQSEA
jgi:hypothetical protein